MQKLSSSYKRVFKLSMLLLSLVVLPATALAISQPGFKFDMEFKPDPIVLPVSYKESDPAIYQSHLALLKFPNQLNLMEKEQETIEISIFENKTLNPVAKQEKLNAARATYNVKLDEVLSRQAEMRKAFFLLARERLLEDNDPYILLTYAQQHYSIRNKAPETIQAEKVETVKQALTTDGNSSADGDVDAESEKVVVEKVVAPKPKGTPSAAVLQKFNTNLEMIIAACDEIRIKFPYFKHQDSVLLLLAAVKQDSGIKKDAVVLWKLFLKQHKSSPHAGMVLFRMAEHEYYNPSSFDHYTTSAELYAKALTYFDSGKLRWRVMYKQAWAEFLSPDMSEGAMGSFIKLYKEIMAAPHMTEEMLSIKTETLEIIRQIKQSGNQSSSKHTIF